MAPVDVPGAGRDVSTAVVGAGAVGGATAAAVASSAAFPPSVIMAASFFSRSTMRFSSLRSSLRTGFPACVLTPRENRIEDMVLVNTLIGINMLFRIKIKIEAITIPGFYCLKRDANSNSLHQLWKDTW